MKVGVVGNPHHLAKKKYEGSESFLWYYNNIMMFYVQ
jgi:hypothetical protein